MIVVYDIRPVGAGKFGTCWPHVASSCRLGAVVELMIQALEREHGAAYEMATYQGERT